MPRPKVNNPATTAKIVQKTLGPPARGSSGRSALIRRKPSTATSSPNNRMMDNHVPSRLAFDTGFGLSAFVKASPPSSLLLLRPNHQIRAQSFHFVDGLIGGEFAANEIHRRVAEGLLAEFLEKRQAVRVVET